MSTLVITNLTSSRLPVGSFVGILSPNEVRSVDMTANELELSKGVLVRLQTAGKISFAVGPTSSDADNQVETVLGGAKVLAGTGAPAGLVFGSPGDLYVNKSGGAATTLYVKESGTNTTAGWVAK